MFQAATNKLEDARNILLQMKSASDSPTFRALFNSFLSSARAISNALQKEGNTVNGFANWYAPKQEEMRGDELLRYIHEARIADFHKGEQRVKAARTHVHHLSSEEAGHPPTPNARISIGTEGPFWIVDQGTARERRIPVQGGRHDTYLNLDNPPKRHAGKGIKDSDPITICSMALEYYEKLVYEAKQTFK